MKKKKKKIKKMMMMKKKTKKRQMVVFLRQQNLLDELIQTGIWVKGALVQVSPLSATVISNVPRSFIDEVIMKEPARFGKFARPTGMISLGGEARLVFL